jgi:general secretion pathway protein D
MRTQSVFVAAVCTALPLIAGATEENANPVSTPASESAPTVELVELIGKVAKKTGKQFVLDPRVAGRVQVAGLNADRVDYDTLLAILRVHDMVVFTQDGVVNVVPDAEARQLPIPTVIGDDSKVGGDELITRLVQARNVCVAHLVPILRPMMPQYAHLAAHPDINTLIIVDRAANARRIADMVERLEKQAAALKQTCLREVKTSS